LRGSRYILGPEVEALEQEFAGYIGVRHVIGVGNGTDALEIAIRALAIGPGDEVITVSHTAVATVAAIESAGAVPVLVDVDPLHYTLNPTKLGAVLTNRTRAVIAVHLYGQAADLDSIGDFCRRNNLALIEDVSQAHGAKWKGQRLGSVGHVGCFSCYPTKNLGAIGDAGLISTNDEALSRRIRILREYGWQQRYVSDIPGRNSRLDEVQAAILRIKLQHLDVDNEKRRRLAAQYSNLLNGSSIHIPKIRTGAEHVFHLYVIRTNRRQELMERMNSNGIYPGVHYPKPIHLQPAYKGRIRLSESLDVTEMLSREVVSLPIYPELSIEMVGRVISAVNAALDIRNY
jgi:dTDP-4-amino-4,6-dideoxygalactose transaminase